MDEGRRLVALEDRLSLDGDTSLRRGERLDVLIAGQWLAGRIEYSPGGLAGYVGWYLRGDGLGWCPVVPGMTALRPSDTLTIHTR